MISPTTLQAVNKGILTDDQLNEALQHYRQLYEDLKCHDEIYRVICNDVRHTLHVLESFKSMRKYK